MATQNAINGQRRGTACQTVSVAHTFSGTMADLAWTACTQSGCMPTQARRRAGQDNPVGVAAGPGAAIVGWLDRRNGYPDIYAQKIGVRISVEVPERPVSSGLSFGLYGAEPNPGNGILRIAFSLRSDEPATLDVHDVAGRRVFSRDVGEFGPGRHVVTVPARAGLASGIYVVRLVAGCTSLTKRACVLR